MPSGNSKVYEYFDDAVSSNTMTSPPTQTLSQKSALLVDLDATETALVFATPYIYFPDLSDSYGFEDYGYIPQALISLITQSPNITSSFPSHASFLPGGPSILLTPKKVEREVLVNIVYPAEDLTISTAFTVPSAGCFHPVACQSNFIQGTTTKLSSTAHNLIQ